MKIFLFFINIFSLCASYLYGKIEGNFEDSLNMSIIINFKSVSNAIIFHGQDTKNNTILITTDRSFPKTEIIIFNLNGMLFRKTAEKFYWSHVLHFALKFYRNNSVLIFKDIAVVFQNYSDNRNGNGNSPIILF